MRMKWKKKKNYVNHVAIVLVNVARARVPRVLLPLMKTINPKWTQLINNL
jgi:hypothetical protein